MKTAEKLSTIMNAKHDIISSRKYGFLKQFFNTISAEEKKQIENYENKQKKQIKATGEYFKKIDDAPEPKPISSVSYQWLRYFFKKTWEAEEGKKLEIDKQQTPIYKAICQYFSKDVEFNKNKLTENMPSLEKGLLIIGKFGCGKTSMMRAYHKIGYKLLPDQFLWFKMISCNALVSEFEKIENQKDKQEFFRKYSKGKTIYFDDFGTESEASNFGKKNLMKIILEERYLYNKKTFLTTNLELEEISKKYGNRVFDRLREMVNIIKMPGNSYRK